MRIFKFGGASVKDAESVRNIAVILDRFSGEELLIIVSAMGKTTNALEDLIRSAYHGLDDSKQLFEEIKAFHLQIVVELFPDPDHEILRLAEELFAQLYDQMKAFEGMGFDMFYDQMVSYGELLSTKLVSCFLNEGGFSNQWLDARGLVMTDNSYRAARIDWDETGNRIKMNIMPVFNSGKMVITQGFIGGHGDYSTSLGREGSDFSAAIFGNILEAEEVVVWKDVPGYLSADPQHYDDAVKLDKISYTEAIELAFYGAKIIHPKTIRPLKNKSIPLVVKSFMAPEEKGSVIHEDNSTDGLVPSSMIKEDQVLISISSRDVSFIAEGHLHKIFGLFTEHSIGLNMMQNSAISFSVCVDHNQRLEKLLEELQKEFKVRYNEGLQLLTIRHYDQETINRRTKGKEILLEQKSRITAQMIIK